jgi:hypothetical protein
VTTDLDAAKGLQQLALRDPDLWIERVFACRLWAKQREIARSVMHNARTVVRSCSGSGKSFLAGRVALCFLHNMIPSTVLTTAPTFRQVESILWAEIGQAQNSARINLAGKLTATRLEIDDDWFALGLSTKEPERFQGFHNVNVLVIGDEASGLSPAIYTAIENPMATGNAHLLYIGNPTQSVGEFRDCFTSDRYEKFAISAYDTPNFAVFGITEEDIESGEWVEKIGGRELPHPYLVTPSWVAGQLSKWGKGNYLYQVYVKGAFPAAGVNNLFNLEDVEAAMAREIPPHDDMIAALDVARYGDDDSVFAYRQGNHVFPMVSWSHADTTYTAGRTVRQLRLLNPARCFIDTVGVGGGVRDMIHEQQFNVDEFNAGSAAVDKERFGNLRAEIYWLLSKKLEEGTLDLPDDDDLKAQLCDIRYRYDQHGRMWIETKEEARARGSKSPDRADALMQLFALLRKGRGGKPNQREH